MINVDNFIEACESNIIWDMYYDIENFIPAEAATESVGSTLKGWVDTMIAAIKKLWGIFVEKVNEIIGRKKKKRIETNDDSNHQKHEVKSDEKVDKNNDNTDDTKVRDNHNKVNIDNLKHSYEIEVSNMKVGFAEVRQKTGVMIDDVMDWVDIAVNHNDDDSDFYKHRLEKYANKTEIFNASVKSLDSSIEKFREHEKEYRQNNVFAYAKNFLPDFIEEMKKITKYKEEALSILEKSNKISDSTNSNIANARTILNKTVETLTKTMAKYTEIISLI